MRSAEEIADAAAAARLWYWRARLEKVIRHYGCHEEALREMDEFRRCVAAALRIGVVARLIEGDLSAQGRPVAQLDGREVELLASRTRERFLGFAWLLGRVRNGTKDRTRISFDPGRVA